MSKFIAINADNADDAIIWAKENCPSYVTYDTISEFKPTESEALLIKSFKWVVKYQFYFNNDQDALMFQLRWA